MKIELVYALTIAVLSIFLTYMFLKRLGKSGCMTYGFIGFIIFSINIFTMLSWVFIFGSSQDVYAISTSGQEYNATVVSYTSEDHYDSDNNKSTIYTPTVQFTTNTGKVIEKKLDFSTSSLEIGDPYKINYNAVNDKVITLGFTLVMKLIGSFIFCFIFTLLFIGVVKYGLGHEMENYKAFASKAGFNFFLPFLMMGFTVLLIYGVFYGNEVPMWVNGILIFFAFVMAIATLGYIKMILTKGTPKMKRVGPNKWEGDWEDDDNDKKKPFIDRR